MVELRSAMMRSSGAATEVQRHEGRCMQREKGQQTSPEATPPTPETQTACYTKRRPASPGVWKNVVGSRAVLCSAEIEIESSSQGIHLLFEQPGSGNPHEFSPSINHRDVSMVPLVCRERFHSNC